MEYKTAAEAHSRGKVNRKPDSGFVGVSTIFGVGLPFLSSFFHDMWRPKRCLVTAVSHTWFLLNSLPFFSSPLANFMIPKDINSLLMVEIHLLSSLIWLGPWFSNGGKTESNSQHPTYKYFLTMICLLFSLYFLFV